MINNNDLYSNIIKKLFFGNVSELILNCDSSFLIIFKLFFLCRRSKEFLEK